MNLHLTTINGVKENKRSLHCQSWKITLQILASADSGMQLGGGLPFQSERRHTIFVQNEQQACMWTLGGLHEVLRLNVLDTRLAFLGDNGALVMRLRPSQACQAATVRFVKCMQKICMLALSLLVC